MKSEKNDFIGVCLKTAFNQPFEASRKKNEKKISKKIEKKCVFFWKFQKKYFSLHRFLNKMNYE
jgi:hypothetical protein